MFAYWPFFLGFGSATYFILPFEPHWYISVIFLTGLVLLFGIIRNKIYQSASIYFLTHAIIAFSLGFTLISTRTTYLNTPFVKTPLKDHTITATVSNVEQTKDFHNRFILSDIDGAPVKKAQVKGNDSIHLEPGWRVKCVVSLLPLSSAVSPIAYNFKRTHYFNGIGASGRIKSCQILEKPTSTINNLRYKITQALRTKLASPYGDIAAALVTGDRSGIPKELRQHYTDAGLAHVLAISGLHLGLVAGIIFFTIKRLLVLGYMFRPVIKLREISAYFTILAMAFYLSLSGFGYPAIRSFGMTTLIMVGIIFNRDPLSIRSVALAASIILMMYPESVLSASFQLSFSAVIALIATYEVTAEPLKKWATTEIDGKHIWYRRLIVYFIAIITTTLVATLATTPLSMAIFNRLTLQAVLGNLLAIPLTGFWIMPTLVVATISLLFGGWDLAFWALEWGIKTLSYIATYVSTLPGSGLMVSSPSNWFYPFFVIGGLMLCIGPWLKIRCFGLVFVLFSFIFFKNINLPIGYFAGDRAVFALYQDNILYVSSLKRGQFFTDQWRQHLGVYPDKVRLIPDQDWFWHGYHVIADPFKNIIDQSLSNSFFKKKYLKSMELKMRDKRVLTNSFWRPKVSISGELLNQKGSAFIYSDGTIQFENDLVKKRPWS